MSNFKIAASCDENGSMSRADCFGTENYLGWMDPSHAGRLRKPAVKSLHEKLAVVTGEPGLPAEGGTP